jgi:hypothetical protein
MFYFPRIGGEKVECKFYDQFVQIFGNKYLPCDSLAEESNGATDMGEVPGGQVQGTGKGNNLLIAVQ